MLLERSPLSPLHRVALRNKGGQPRPITTPTASPSGCSCFSSAFTAASTASQSTFFLLTGCAVVGDKAKRATQWP